MTACWQKSQELWEEHKVKNNQYWEDQQAWLKQQREEKQLKYERPPLLSNIVLAGIS